MILTWKISAIFFQITREFILYMYMYVTLAKILWYFMFTWVNVLKLLTFSFRISFHFSMFDAFFRVLWKYVQKTNRERLRNITNFTFETISKFSHQRVNIFKNNKMNIKHFKLIKVYKCLIHFIICMISYQRLFFNIFTCSWPNNIISKVPSVFLLQFNFKSQQWVLNYIFSYEKQ